jgi:phage major head subunit gpT-like protein
VNAANLEALFVGFKVMFQETLKATPSRIDEIASRIPSSTKQHDFPIAAIVGTMREWLGDRVVTNIAAWNPTVTNKHFEQTIAVTADDIEDDVTGAYGLAIQDLAQKAVQHPWTEALTWLAVNAWADTGFDDNTFFSTTHTWPGGDYVTAQSNRVTTALTNDDTGRTAVWTGIEAMLSFRNPAGEPIGSVPNKFLCAAGLLDIATALFTAPTAASGATNTTFGLFKKEDIIADARITAGYWMMLDCRGAVKPLINQRRKEPVLVAQTQPTDQSVFTANEYQYGVDYRGRVVGVPWWLAYGSTGA